MDVKKRKKTLTISQLSRTAGVPTTTIRYYERIGLLTPSDRSEGNYRLYDDQCVGRLRFVRAAQSIGFTLDDIKILIGFEGSEPTCVEVQNLIQKRLTDVEEQLRSLLKVRKVLKGTLAKCREEEEPSACHVLESLCCRNQG